MRPVSTATIRGKRYKIVWSLPPVYKSKLKTADSDDHEIMGICEHPRKKGKRVAFELSQCDTELEVFNTVLHEVLHAAFWDLDEDSIIEASTDITRLLARLGFKRTEPLPGMKPALKKTTKS